MDSTAAVPEPVKSTTSWVLATPKICKSRLCTLRRRSVNSFSRWQRSGLERAERTRAVIELTDLHQLAPWTMLARVLLNLDETITKE